MVDLSGMPSVFFNGLAYRDGRDIRAKDASGADIPFDLVSIAPDSKRGVLFVRCNLSSDDPTEFFIHYGNTENSSPVPPGATNGRYACWSGFDCVYTFGSDYSDRAGNASQLAYNNLVYGFVNASTSADIGVHQGIVWDGAHYYAIDTNKIKKYDASFALVTQNTNPCGEIGYGVNHLGDGEIVGDLLYIPAETYTDPDGHANMRIAVFNRSDLTLVTSYSVAYASGVTTGVDMSGCAYNPADGLLYFGAWTGSGNMLWKWSTVTHEFVGTLSLSISIQRIQGLTFWRDAIWINRDDTDRTVRVELDGTVRGMAWGIIGGSYEGISHNDDGLLVLHDTTGLANGVVKHLRPRTVSPGNTLGIYMAGGAEFNGYLRADGIPKRSTWTMGVSAITLETGTTRGVMSYGVTGSGDDANRASIALRGATTKFGLWNSSDSWIESTSTVSTSTAYRLNAIHDGTTYRSLYVNGSLNATDTGTVNRPSTTPNSIWFGTSDHDGLELWNGQIGYAYLYPGVLSADWLAAEASNVNSPSTFYSIGTPETL